MRETPKITVVVRKRPLNRKELQRNETDIVKVADQSQVVISEYKQKVDLTKYLEETTFNFDYAYDHLANNQQIYEQSVRPLIHNAFQGAKISCFAYGQTGSGKTYTMRGDMGKGIPGIYYLGAREIFHLLQQPQNRSKEVVVTFYEIYCGKLYDLLNSRNVLPIREDKKGNINVIGLNEKFICGAEEFMDLVEQGSLLRVTSQNATNEESSRSHAILQISIKDRKTVFSKISFIDLAGNERGADHMNMNKQTKIDGAEISKSLLSLKECIRALDQGKSHTPFRGSKLTMVLKDSFVGYCNTVMICNISPNTSSSENTMNTLRYADRVKELKNNDGQHLSKEEQLARELMLPRANKQSLKVNIERGEDHQEIMLKMDLQRAMQDPHHYQPRPLEQKMDIEQPKQSVFAPSSHHGRKTENGGRVVGKGGLRGQEYDKQPLLSRNNNLNGINGSPFNQNYPKAPQQQSMSLNRSQFEAMNSLKGDFMNYKEEHDRLMNEEMRILREECSMREDYRNIGESQHYEEEIDNVSHYLQEMERFIHDKEELIHIMKTNCTKLRAETRTAEIVTAKLRHQQNQQHSQQDRPMLNGLFGGQGSRSKARLPVPGNGLGFEGFNGQSQYGDEQLLEGLGEEPVQRLF